MDITTHMPGSFCTAVLRTRDLERAVAFPEGAMFGLWQPSPHQGAQLTEEVGSL